MNKLLKKNIKNPSLELEIRLCGNKFNNTLNNIRLNQLEFQRLLQQLTVSKDLNGLGLKYENTLTFFNLHLIFIINNDFIISLIDVYFCFNFFFIFLFFL